MLISPPLKCGYWPIFGRGLANCSQVETKEPTTEVAGISPDELPTNAMIGNIEITLLPQNEDFWLAVAITSVREVRPQQGKSFRLATARNASGTVVLKISDDILQANFRPAPGLWRIAGRLELFQGHPQVVVSEL